VVREHVVENGALIEGAELFEYLLVVAVIDQEVSNRGAKVKVGLA